MLQHGDAKVKGRWPAGPRCVRVRRGAGCIPNFPPVTRTTLGETDYQVLIPVCCLRDRHPADCETDSTQFSRLR
jgi:hypothetical protein